MGLGAIVVVGTELGPLSGVNSQRAVQESLLAEPLECVEILGRSMLERTIETFLRIGLESVSVLVPEELAYAVQQFPASWRSVNLQFVGDVTAAVTNQIKEYSRRGIDHAFVSSGNLYTDTDLLDFFYFHREANQAATCACDSETSLDLWVVDCERAQKDIHVLLGRARESGVSYFIREYVSRLAQPRDLRTFACDTLRGRSCARPAGTEIKPGIWVGEGADIHRRARIVAPAYIGANCEVREDTLVTRFSSLERDCYVDYGTVVEDSSILADTHIGIWLDVCHSVAKGSKLFNLERDVMLEISDRSILRATSSVREDAKSLAAESRKAKNRLAQLQREQKHETPAPERWQFGANPIQG